MSNEPTTPRPMESPLEPNFMNCMAVFELPPDLDPVTKTRTLYVYCQKHGAHIITKPQPENLHDFNLAEFTKPDGELDTAWKEHTAPYPIVNPTANDKEWLGRAASAVKAEIPDNHGFILFAFPFTENPNDRLRYAASVERQDAIRVLKNFFFKLGEGEPWMEHVK